jgi:hypothetical protein
VSAWDDIRNKFKAPGAYDPAAGGAGLDLAAVNTAVDARLAARAIPDTAAVNQLITAAITAAGGSTGGSGGGPDTTPPTAPGTPVAVLGSKTGEVTLTFAASTDAVGVTGYEVYSNIDGYTAPVGTGTASPLKVTVSVLGQGTTFKIRAKDAASNWSPLSAASNSVLPQAVGTLRYNLGPQSFAAGAQDFSRFGNIAYSDGNQTAAVGSGINMYEPGTYAIEAKFPHGGNPCTITIRVDGAPIATFNQASAQPLTATYVMGAGISGIDLGVKFTGAVTLPGTPGNHEAAKLAWYLQAAKVS